MSTLKEIFIPDIGGAENVDVIEILVSKGQAIKKEEPLITLESDKATMEIPSPQAGNVHDIHVNVGDKVSQGKLILTLDVSDENAEVPSTPTAEKKVDAPANTAKTKGNTTQQTVNVPDIGDAKNVEVIEILVNVGDEVALDDPLITLESEKASMDIPAPCSGKITHLLIKVGDKVSQGDAILTMTTETATSSNPPEIIQTSANNTTVSKLAAVIDHSEIIKTNAKVYASPSVRRIAREFGVDLNLVTGSGRKHRILKEDVQTFVKNALQQRNQTGTGFGFKPAPAIDFSQFGEINTLPLNKIKRLTGENVHRSWISIPHVTQFDEVDITELEQFRQAHKDDKRMQGAKLTPLIFIMTAVVKCLQAFPTFNSSLDASAENLIIKNYFHLGIAVDTPNGLVVPVVRNVDQKTIFQLAIELAEISQKARDKKLMPKDMQGGSFTISSLGGISGTGFTPIVNSPEVAILGISRSKIQPVFTDGEFLPRLIMPYALSYDHRVIDGAEAARFTKLLNEYLNDIRELLL
ncbi:MAG: dihydrolipoyllysine-residue acetyltransferase [Legionellales bacterium]|nr:dihydrolipoyllysine-residue acetyltransferase [Legionellales bacterium]